MLNFPSTNSNDDKDWFAAPLAELKETQKALRTLAKWSPNGDTEMSDLLDEMDDHVRDLARVAELHQDMWTGLLAFNADLENQRDKARRDFDQMLGNLIALHYERENIPQPDFRVSTRDRLRNLLQFLGHAVAAEFVGWEEDGGDSGYDDCPF